MRIKQLEITNFKVFQRPTVIDFPEAEKSKNIYLIGGVNGSGKTTILEALNLCLYGGKAKQIFEWINKNERERGNCEISFKTTFETDSRDELEVKRLWKPGGVLVNEPKPEDLEEMLIISKNGERFRAVDHTSWQEYINATIPEGISGFFFFNGEKIEGMAEDEGSSLRLKSSIETILGLEILRKLVEDLDRVKREIKRAATAVSDVQVKKEQAEVELLQEHLENLENTRKDLLDEIEEVKEKKQTIRDQFTERFGFSPEAREKLNTLKQKRTKLEVELGKIDEGINKYCNETLPLALLADYFPKIKAQLEIEEEIRKGKALEKEREKLAERIIATIYKEDTCPIGKEFVGVEDKKMLTEIVSEAIRGKSEGKEILLGLSEAQVQNLSSVLHSITQSTAQNLVPLLKRRKNFQQRVENIERESGRLELQEAEEEDFQKMQEELLNHENLLGRKKGELDQIEEKIFNKKEEIKNKNKDLDYLYQRYEQTRAVGGLLRKTGQSQNVLEEYIKILREKKLKDLRDKVFEMYQKLAFKSDLMKDIDIDPHTYTVSIIDKQGRQIEKKNLSAGEKEIYAISLLWGLAKTSAYDLPVIVDTPLARLDVTHRSRIVENYFPEAGRQVIVLSTDAEIDQEYYNKLKPYIARSYHLNFDKERQWSTVEQGYFWE